MALVSRTLGLFNSPTNINAWLADAVRTTPTLQHQQPAVDLVEHGLRLLHELVVKGNPQAHNPLYARASIHARFAEAADYGYSLGMFFEGLSDIEGHGCKQNLEEGKAKIRIAASRKCPEALNFSALCVVQTAPLTAIQLLHAAASMGHNQALRNYQTLAARIQAAIRTQSTVVEFPLVTVRSSSRPNMR